MPPRKTNSTAKRKPATPLAVFNQLLENPDFVGNMMTMRSELLRNFFDPRRDIDEECGYPKTINEEQYRAMFDRELGVRVVNVYPEETWKKMPRIYEDPDPETNTPFEESLEAFENKHHLLHYMQRVDELSGIGHYGIILWGLDDGLELHKPVDGSDSWEVYTGKPRTTIPPEHHVLYMRALDASLVNIATYETNPTKPRYGQPMSYTITLADPRTIESDATANPPEFTEIQVHWSRVSHIADNRKTSEVLGTPRMQPVWNRLYDLRKILAGCGEMFWKGGFPGLSLETQPGLENAAIDEEKTRAALFNYMNGLQRFLLNTGLTAKSLGPQIADPSATFETQIKAICITLGVPYRVFMGIEEGVVSGDQATKAWDSRLANRQERYVTPMLIDPIIQRLVDFGAIKPTKEPQGWTVEWPDLTVPSEKDKAEVSVAKTEALAKYVAGGVDTLVPPMEYLTIFSGLDEETAASILKAAVKHINSIGNENEDTPAHGPTPPQFQEGDEGPGAGASTGKEETEEMEEE